MPRCRLGTAKRRASAGTSVAGDLWSGNGADVFRYAGVKFEYGAGEFGVWTNRGGGGGGRRLFGGAGHGSGCAGFAGIDGNSDGSNRGGEHEFDASCDYGIRACSGAAGQQRVGVDYSSTLEQRGNGVLIECEQGCFLWDGSGVPEDELAG